MKNLTISLPDDVYRRARVKAAEQILQGETPGSEAFAAAAENAGQAVDPVDDIYGSVEYKRHLVMILTQRALSAAVARVRTFAAPRLENRPPIPPPPLPASNGALNVNTISVDRL